MISSRAHRQLTSLLSPDYYSNRTEELVLYGSDGTNNPDTRPEAVARPGSTNEVVGIVKLAREHGIPIVPRGAGSGLSGGALPTQGGLVVVMNRFNRMINLDTENLVAEVEPGVITAEFQTVVEKEGMFYPPDPASRDFSTLGGNAAENAGGTRAVKYGVTRDYILGLEAVLGTGELVRTGVRTAKGVVGYDLTRLLVGSEGTLAIITGLILRLLPKPEAKETVLAYFDDLYTAGQTVAAITAARIIPATLEFMDKSSISCVEGYLKMGLDRTAGALLLVETDGSQDQALREAEKIADICRGNGARSVKRAETRIEAENMWQARRALSPALFRAATGKFNEDIVVPRSRIPDMINRIENIADTFQLTIINFGHAGDGNIHVNVMFDRSNPRDVKKAEAAVREIMTATLELGGTLSGEHGIGTTKKNLIGLEISPESLALMKRIKKAFDPDGIMNPGKIFPS
jgi:glycolate oxidase